MKIEILNKLGITDPYQNIPQMTHNYKPHGWNSDSINLLLARNKNMCLEIGSWMGGSANTLCGIIPENSVLLCCDTFLGSHEHFLDKTIPTNEYGKSLLYECFLNNTKKNANKIIPIQLGSSSAFEVFRRLNIKFDFIYIDGDHRTNSVYNDIKESYSLLNNNGIILGDDYSWGTVQDGVNLFLKENPNLNIEINSGQYIIKN